ncbi:MAG: hypothetical protein QCI38_04665 [Candidatus Thermoplasmatota archaeon]|nr:hypothetical protein [Candidatus Thermoplasmatota archaeon]
MVNFVVVGCPNCGWIRGIVVGSKKTTCQQCGKTVKASALIPLAQTDSERDLPMLVAAVRASIEGEEGVVGPPPTSPTPHALTSSSPGGKKMDAADIAMALSSRCDFTEEEFLEMALKEGVTKPLEKLHKLLSQGMVLEPKPGKYRWVKT